MGTFEDVYRTHVQTVFRFALSVAGRRELAEDLTSEAFLALYRNFDAIDQGQLPAWLLISSKKKGYLLGKVKERPRVRSAALPSVLTRQVDLTRVVSITPERHS